MRRKKDYDRGYSRGNFFDKRGNFFNRYDRGYGRGSFFAGRDRGYSRGGFFDRGNYGSGSYDGWEDEQEVPTLTSTVLGFLTKAGEKGRSVLKKKPPVKVNVFTYDSCKHEGGYVELDCEVEGR